MNPDEEFGRGGLNRFLDTDELIDRIGLTPHEIAWRKSFIGFDEADEKRLASLEGLMRENQTQIAEDFYQNLLAYEQTRDVIERSPKGVDALKMTQRAYLVSLANGTYDQAYFRNRARIGKLHEMLDMPLKHYVGQYGVYYNLILREVNDQIQEQVIDAIEEWADEQETEQGGLSRFAGALGFGQDEDVDGLDESFEQTVRDAIDDGMADVLALLRIINLDLQVAADTYVDSYAQRLETQIERRKQLAAEVEEDVQVPLEELYDASEDVARAATQITEITDEQATNLETASTELTDVSAAVEEVASVANEVSTHSERTETLTEKARESATDTQAALTDIEAAVENVETATTQLEERMNEVDAVVDRIESLTERTKMLATNARVEATRSGKAGSPLKTIANEVSSFADRSQRELSAIETALEDVRAETKTTLEATTETVDAVDTGTARVRETLTALEDIHEAAEVTAAGMEDVAAATDQQAVSVERVAQTVEETATAGETVAAEAQSVAAASEQQVASVGSIGDSVARLIDDDGVDAEPPIYERVQ